MTKEEIYLKRKKEELIRHVNKFNERNRSGYQFQIDSENLDIESTFCNSHLCDKCGNCCATFPCIFAPSDFLDITDIDYMSELLDTGLICFSQSEDKKVLLLRPRGLGDKSIWSDLNEIKYTYDGANPCILQSKNGCLLPPIYRPTEGLLHLHSLTMYKTEYIEEEYRSCWDALINLIEKGTFRGELEPEYIVQKPENINRLIRSLVGHKN